MIKKIILTVLFLPVISFAFSEKTDFKFFSEIKDLELNKLNYIYINNNIESKSEKFLSDIRIFNKDGKEVGFILKKEKDRYKTSEKKIKLDIVRKSGNVYIIDLKKDLKEDDYLNNIFIETDSVDFRRLVDIQAADIKEGPYFNLNIQGKRGDLIYDLPEGRDFSIDFKYSNYKYLKLTFSGDEGDLKISNFYRIKKETIVEKAERDFVKAIVEKKNIFDDNKQEIILDTGFKNVFFDNLELKFFDKKFKRRYILYSSDDKNSIILESNKRFDPKKNYWVKLSSGYLFKDSYTPNPKINLNNNKRYYRLDIFNEDNDSLNFDSAVFEKIKKRIYFVPKENNLKIYYSSNRVDSPKYDLFFKKEDYENTHKEKLTEEKKNEDYIVVKKNIFDDNKYLIYLLIGVVILILGFFVYKILRETNNKTDKEGMQI
jgi:hypothetical protein